VTAQLVARSLLQLAGGLVAVTGAAYLVAEAYLRCAGWRSANSDDREEHHRAKTTGP